MKAHRALTILILATAFLSACGSQTFSAVESQQNSDSPGGVTIPPKVDILVAIDNSGSMSGYRDTVLSQLRSFMNTLQSTNWDYRLAMIPLVSVDPVTHAAVAPPQISQVAASKYDRNWGSEWIPSSPLDQGAGSLPAGIFRKPTDFNAFYEAGSSTKSDEMGLKTIALSLQDQTTKDRFLRQEALLVVIVLSNGDDASEAPIVSGGFNYGPPKTVKAELINNISAAKPTGMLRLYAAVNTSGASCLNATDVGYRYTNAASQLGGAGFNLCNSGALALSGVVSNLQYALQSIRVNFLTDYLFLPEEPQLATVKVYKRDANGNERLLSASEWEYKGKLFNQDAVYYQEANSLNPIQSGSGYAFHLLGNGVLHGNETARITYLPIGVNPTP